MSTADTPLADAAASVNPAINGTGSMPDSDDAGSPETTRCVDVILPTVRRSPAAERAESPEYWYLCGDGSAYRAS